VGSAELWLATGNPNKVAELAAMLSGRYVVQPRPEGLTDTIEDGETLEANALKKAREVAAATNGLAVADDTGLFVDALDGRPGVYSARYAEAAGMGEEGDAEANMKLLLSELDGLDGPDARQARFVTVIAVVGPGREDLTVTGTVEGWITPDRRGGEGFGYDPIFVPDEGNGSSFAEMGLEAKNKISHRARAVAALLEVLS